MSVRTFVTTHTPRDVKRMRNLGGKSFAEFVMYLSQIDAPLVQRWIATAEEYLPDGVISADALAGRIAELEEQLGRLRAMLTRAIPKSDLERVKRPQTFFPAAVRSVAQGETLAAIGRRTGVSRERVRQQVTATLEHHLPVLFEKFKASRRNLCEFLCMHRNTIDAALSDS